MLIWWEPPAAPAPRIPAPQSTHLVLRGFSAQNPVSGLAGGAQHPAEGMESHIGAHLTDFVQQPLKESATQADGEGAKSVRPAKAGT
jgi:hypothetical protein